jgi:hypothetical protein
MHIIVDLDGTLRGPRNDEPIAQAIQVVGALSAWNQISLITEMTKPEAEQWLNQNKVVDFDHVFDKSYHLEGETLKFRQITQARAKGRVDLVITADPTVWVFAFNQGIPALMFGMPDYLRAEFRPDAPKKVRAWDDIVDAITKQNELRTKDARLTRTETLRFGD